MFVHVSQQVSVAKNAPVIPEEAIQADVKGYYVYKVVSDKVGQTYIKVGTRVDNQAQVLSGLNIGDTIVVAGQQKLDDGSVIKVQKMRSQFMKLSEICIRQPVLAIVLSLILVVLVVVAFQRLELRFFPKLELPILTVATTYDGVSAQLMESQVTT